MESVLELKGKLQNVYAQYSTYIDKVVRFVLAFVAFFMINREIGYMHMLANPVVALGLAVICAFLPPIFTLIAGAVLTMAHVYSVSLGMLDRDSVSVCDHVCILSSIRTKDSDRDISSSDSIYC